MRAQTPLDFAIGVSVFLVVVTFVLAFVPGMLQPFEGSTQKETVASDRIAGQLVENSLVADQREPYVLDRECTVIFFESREDGNDPGGDDDANVNGNGTFAAPFDTGTYDGTCNFEDLPLRDRLGVSASGVDVRVRLVRDLTVGELDSPDDDDDDAFDASDTNDSEADTLCVDANSDHRIIEAGDPTAGGTECDIAGGDDDVLFAIGDTPPDDSGSVVVARRIVYLKGGFGDGTSEASLIVEVW